MTATDPKRNTEQTFCVVKQVEAPGKVKGDQKKADCGQEMMKEALGK